MEVFIKHAALFIIFKINFLSVKWYRNFTLNYLCSYMYTSLHIECLFI